MTSISDLCPDGQLYCKEKNAAQNHYISAANPTSNSSNYKQGMHIQTESSITDVRHALKILQALALNTWGTTSLLSSHYLYQLLLYRLSSLEYDLTKWLAS